MPRVFLRPLTEEDLPLLLAWAQNPQIWKYMPTSRKGEQLTWEKHYQWWRQRKNRNDWLVFYENRPVGVVHADFGREPVEVGIYIAEIELWGRGIAKEALSQALRLIGRHRVQAVIHPRNKRSLALFASLGFKKIGKARTGQDLYEIAYSSD